MKKIHVNLISIHVFDKIHVNLISIHVFDKIHVNLISIHVFEEKKLIARVELFFFFKFLLIKNCSQIMQNYIFANNKKSRKKSNNKNYKRETNDGRVINK